ncbi:MAG: hypothetical protein ACMG6H_06475, partial [Acidobacteriota bacterium]
MIRRGPVTAGKVGASKAARRAGGKAVGAPATGLTGFSLDASEAAGRTAFAALTKTRSTFPGFAGGAALNLKRLAPETAALNHLDHALASDAVKKFARPRIGTAASAFQSLGAEAIPLTGTTVVKFRQAFNKIPVYGSLVTVELDQDNECLAINSTLGTPAGVNHVAKVSPADAMKVAAKCAGQSIRDLNQTPRLYYYFDQDGKRWRLAYIIEDVVQRRPKVLPEGRSDAARKDYVVDANSGRLLAELP